MTIVGAGNVPLLYSPQGVSTRSTEMVDFSLMLADYFMAKVYDNKEE